MGRLLCRLLGHRWAVLTCHRIREQRRLHGWYCFRCGLTERTELTTCNHPPPERPSKEPTR